MTRQVPKIRRRIRSKLIVIYLVPTLAIIAGFGTVFYFMVRFSLEQEMGRRLVAIASSAALHLPLDRVHLLAPGEEESLNYEKLRERLIKVRDANEATRISLFNPDGASLLDTRAGIHIGQLLPELEADRLEIERVLTGQPTASTLFAGPSGALYMSGYAPLLGEDGLVAAMVRVDASVVFFDQLKALRRNLVFVEALAGLAIVVISLLFASRIERPIAELVDEARRIGEGELEREIEPHGEDEIGFLARSMEEMRANIVARDEHLLMLQRGIAHEVRNPLGGIGLFIDLLSEELGADQDEARGYVAKIRKELRSLDRVVNDFLDFTRSIVPEPRRVNLGEFLDEVVPLISGQALERDITVEREDGHLQDCYMLDQDLLRRVLLNLLTNSAQACGPGGLVRIVTNEGEGELRISVLDNGSGIKPENIEKIFEPFFTTKERGSGLGLSYSLKIVQALGGELKIQRAPDHGTLATVILPLE
ncbi:MAG: HAMP domain-containing sensor histidine kinase [Candidatus Alcyoniella australis]|nr:HAMP domain-containing sensor histidine kinase [Candidatus Alcyoniella australis]